MGKTENAKVKKTGITGGMAVGCLIDIAMLVCFALAMGEDTAMSALAYAIILALPVLFVRWLLLREDRLDGWMGRLLSPSFLAAAMLLAVYLPIEIDKPDGETGPVTPQGIAEKAAAKAANAAADKKDGKAPDLPPPTRRTGPRNRRRVSGTRPPILTTFPPWKRPSPS